MTEQEKLQELADLWDLARIIHEARKRLAWGRLWDTKEPWPALERSYLHHPIAYVDLALAAAGAVRDNFKIDLSLAAGPAIAKAMGDIKGQA